MYTNPLIASENQKSYFVDEEKPQKRDNPKIPDISSQILLIGTLAPQQEPKKLLKPVKFLRKNTNPSDDKSNNIRCKRKLFDDENIPTKKIKSDVTQLSEKLTNFKITDSTRTPKSLLDDSHDFTYEGFGDKESVLNLSPPCRERLSDSDDFFAKVRGCRLSGDQSPLETEGSRSPSPPPTPRLKMYEKMDRN